MAVGKKTGGRKAGTPNKATKQVREIVASVLTPEMEAKAWKRWLSHKDDAIAWDAFKLAMAYKHGKPSNTVKFEADDGVTFSVGTIAEETFTRKNVSSGTVH
jgi:hypothetical protein